LERGFAELSAGDQGAAMQDLDAALSADPQLWYGYYLRGGLRRKNGDAEGAMADYGEAIRLNPGEWTLYNSRAGLFREIGNAEKAIEDYRKAGQIQPAARDVFYNLGLVYSSKSLHEEAMAQFTKALSLDADDADAYEKRGWCRFKSGDVAGAVEDCEAALRLGGSRPRSHVGLALCSAALGNMEEALSRMNDAVRADETAMWVRLERQD